VIGIPLLLILIFLKGLVIGFTVGFLVNQLSWKGLWFAFMAVVPQNLLVIPAMLIVTVAGIRFSVQLVKNRLISHRGSIYPQFVAYSILVTIMAVMMFLSSTIEAYVSPTLMKKAVPTVEAVSGTR
jgi:stage II sporulation protein M